MRLVCFALLLFPVMIWAELAVSVQPPKATATKAVVKMEIKNTFAEKVESARATVFLLDEKGKIIGQATRWVIGGNKQKAGLAPDTTHTFNFVIGLDKPLIGTNFTTKVNFSRIVLEGGKLADPKDVQIQPK